MSFNNKFGMFIHWGIYSQLGIQEQAFVRCDINREKYEKLVHIFNPILYNPEEWVLLAKKCGMKYICFTTKHHDGFCMWNTKYSSYNIMNTPYKKDVLKMLSDACKKHDMKLSLYYSCPDWNHEYGYNPNSSHQWLAVNKDNPDMDKYIEYVKNQITELLTGYGDIYTLFWDIPPKIVDSSVNELVRKLQPDILINNRGFDSGDFSTPERDYDKKNESKLFEKMTEACNSVGEQSWGYRKNEDYQSIRYLTSSIDRIMAMGGSYLLNVGPKEDGTIPKEAAEVVLKVGDWYNRMEGCLENVVEDTFNYEIVKHKYVVNKKGNKSYFHFYDGITSSAIAFRIYPCMPKRVRLMNNDIELPFENVILPEYFDGSTGRGIPHLHIYDIPVNDLSNEPIVIEIEW